MRQNAKTPSAQSKVRIQALLRQIAIKRDKTCVLRAIRHCNDEVLQYDHLITRANSATYADPRLGVLLCRSCHGWKHWHEREYNALVKTLLPEDRVTLWDKCEQDSWRPTRKYTSDWLKEESYLKTLLEEI